MQMILPRILRKVNKEANGGKGLPFEYPLKKTLKIYIHRWGLWLAVVSVGLIPLAIWIIKQSIITQ